MDNDFIKNFKEGDLHSKRDMKDHWIIPHVDRVTIVEPPQPYPVHITLSHHKYIEAIEIPNADYVHFKIKGEWKTVYLKLD